MPTNRFQFSDDFVLNNGNVGINSATPQTKLDVVGVVRGDNLKVTGVSTFTTYEGFLNSNQNIVENTTISGGGISGSLSGEIIVGTGITVTVASGTTSSQGNVDSLKVYNTFTVPVGGTADRPPKPTPGQLFFNRDFATMEFWDGDRWRQVDNTTQIGRGVFGGGGTPTLQSSIEFINISSTGNSLDFGTLLTSNSQFSAFASSIRGVFAGYGSGGSVDNVIQYITIASQSNAIDFGDLTVARRMSAACSSSTRGIVGGGVNPTSVQNVIDYIQISTIGNALDFGDLTIARRTQNGSCASPTRGVFLGGRTPSEYINVIEFITIASTGNATDFGDSLFTGAYRAGCSNTTRGIFAGGSSSSPTINTIEYITISSTGNAIYFGDLTIARSGKSGLSNNIRGVFGGGYVAPNVVNIIDYITIASTGNAQDFGDLIANKAYLASCSDSHGGLGGF